MKARYDNKSNLVKKLAIILAFIIFVLLGVAVFYKPAKGPTVSENPATTTHQAVFSPDGSIAVTAPQRDTVIKSPMGVQGQASGGWFFEAAFPIKILDGDGKILGRGNARAMGEWMTAGTVPFSATIAFAAPKYATGTIVFKKDNPSDLPRNGGEFRLRVRFK